MKAQESLRIQEMRNWLTKLDMICRSDEVRELIRRLQKEDNAYPQAIVTVEEE